MKAAYLGGAAVVDPSHLVATVIMVVAHRMVLGNPTEHNALHERLCLLVAGRPERRDAVLSAWDLAGAEAVAALLAAWQEAEPRNADCGGK